MKKEVNKKKFSFVQIPLIGCPFVDVVVQRRPVLATLTSCPMFTKINL